MEMRDRKVLLTGAAGALGTAIALAIAKNGARVLALDIDGAKGAALLAECARQNAPPGSLRFIAGDLTDLAATAALVRTLCQEENGVDILINNAAIYPSHLIEDYTIEQLEAVQRVNVQAGIVAAQAVIPGMKQRGFGRIINVASVTLNGGWADIF